MYILKVTDKDDKTLLSLTNKDRKELSKLGKVAKALLTNATTYATTKL